MGWGGGLQGWDRAGGGQPAGPLLEAQVPAAAMGGGTWGAGAEPSLTRGNHAQHCARGQGCWLFSLQCSPCACGKCLPITLWQGCLSPAGGQWPLPPRRQVKVPDALPDLPAGTPGPGQDKGTSVQLRNPEVLSETTGGAGRAGGAPAVFYPAMIPCCYADHHPRVGLAVPC